MNKNTVTIEKKSILILIAFLITGLAILIISLFKNHSILSNAPSSMLQTPQIYYGITVDMSQLLPDSRKYVKNSSGEDIIDVAHSLGVNLIRIVSGYYSYKGSYVPYTEKQWNSVLDKMQRNNIKALILVESPPEQVEFYPGTFTSSHSALLQQLVLDSNVGNHPAVFGIDLKNEPDLSPNHLALLEQERTMVKSKYPNLLVTVGGWRREAPTYTPSTPHFIWNDPQDGKLLQNIVDFYAVHIYYYDIPQHNIFPNAQELTSQYLKKIVSYANGKSVLIEEFGAGNGDELTDQNTLGGKELQQTVYAGVYQTVQEMKSSNIIGAVQYDFISRGGYPDGWVIAKNDLSYLYPAAKILQAYATNQPIPQIIVPAQKEKIVTVNDANKNVIVPLDTTVVLELRINWNRHMELTVTDPTLFDQTEPLFYDANSHKYLSVFHPKRAGQTTLTLHIQSGCIATNCIDYSQDLYQTTITVE